MFRERLHNLEQRAFEELSLIKDEVSLECFRIAYLGKKGEVLELMKELRNIPPEDRPEFGQKANDLRSILTERFESVKNNIKKTSLIHNEFLDISLSGRRIPPGYLHPINIVLEEVCGIFERMGFNIVTGPNIELDYYNFEALNLPKDHPARDMQDTFYISDSVVLRTHTSPMQVRVMEKQLPPVSIIAPGKVYRRDSDVSHTPMFHQVEGLLVDKNITFGDLKGTLTGFLHQIFGSKVKLRFRPSFFPFTEPSAEVDIQCVMCGGEGCRTCSQSGWLEILGCGMVDPAVYGFVDYDPEIYSGFAFGMGIERITMLKYGINDIQLFFKNDMRFLSQF